MKRRFNSGDVLGADNVAAFIHAHLDEKLHYKLLCRIACMNRNKLNAIFKFRYGTSLGRYILKARMELARKLVSEGEESLLEISERTGYLHYSNFLAAYKKYWGRSAGHDKGSSSGSE